MQLRKLKFWGQSPSEDQSLGEKESTESHEKSENVVSINNENHLNAPVGWSDKVPLSDSSYVKISRDTAKFGPMSCEEVSQFFSRNFVNCGRYTGSMERTQDSLELGLKTIIAQFQNVLAVVIGRIQSMIHDLKNIEAQTDGLSSSLKNQLELKRDKFLKELSILEEQLSLSEERKWWVLSALNEYRIGFDRGLREAIDAEILGL